MNRANTHEPWDTFSRRCPLNSTVAGIGAVLLVLATPGAAAGQIHGYIESIEYARQCSSAWDGCVLVTMSETASSPANCSDQGDRRTMALDPNAISADRDQHGWMLRAIESAYARGVEIYLIGSGHCHIHSGFESVQGVSMSSS